MLIQHDVQVIRLVLIGDDYELDSQQSGSLNRRNNEISISKN